MLIKELHKMPGHLIRRVHQISSASFADNLTGFDLTSVQFAALVVIGATPGIDATRLSELIVIDRATIGGVLDRLESKTLISRTASKQDRRIKTVLLTAAGEALLAETEHPVRHAQKDMLTPLTTPERRQLAVLLQKIIDFNKQT